MKENVSIR